jgi:hypothetical protein
MVGGTAVGAEAIRSALRCGNSGCACHKGPNVHCPAHQDKQPSLTVHDAPGGKVLVNCKTGCQQSDVIEALRARGLWEERKPAEEPSRNGSADHPVATYEYRNEQRELVAIKGRFETGEIDPATKKPLKSFRWKLPGRDRWSLEGMPISAIPLWGAELLPDIPPEVRVFVVEGEKAAKACRAMGLFAVCHPGGASTKDFGASFEALRGRDVVLWPDNDDPGRKFMDAVRGQLRGVARSVVTIFPTVPDKGDAVEYFGAGHSVADLLAQVPVPPRPVLEYLSVEDEDGCAFRRHGLGYGAIFHAQGVYLTVDHLRRSGGEMRGEVLVEAGIPSIPSHLYWGSLILSSGANREKLAKTLEGRTRGLGIDWDGIIEVVCRKVALAEREGEPFATAGDLEGEAQSSDWLISNFAPRLEPTTIWGDGGVGKSMLTLALAVSVKAGVEIVPGFSPAVQGNVLYLDWESSRVRVDTRVKRICAGAGIPPVVIGYRRCTVPLVDQVEEVLRYCQSEGVVLVVLDSVEMAMNGTGGDGSNPNEKVIVLHSALRMLGTTSVLIDHISAASRGRDSTAGKPIGGVYKTNLARMAFELRKGSDLRAGQMNLGLFNMKRNDDGALMKAIGLKVTFGEEWTRYEREGITDGALMAGLTVRDRMVATLKQYGQLPNKQLAELVDAPQNTVNGELSRHNGTIFVKVANGNWALCAREEGPQDEIPF